MKTLHIHCGDSSAGMLARSGVTGEILVWREIYIAGPVPGGLPETEWRRVRAAFLTSFGLPLDGVLRETEARYAKLAGVGAFDEVVLWFDACLFDQTLLIHLLDRLGRVTLNQTVLSLICISDRGLGELRPDEMAALFPTRALVTAEQIRLAQDAWAAFTAPDPRRIESVLARDCAALPYLAPALRRHLQQFPSVRNGLNRLQNQALEVVAAGTAKLGPIFVQVSDREEQKFIGDTMLWACLDELARGRAPLLAIAGPEAIVRPLHEPLQDLDRWTVTITDQGRAVLRGEADWVRLNGIDSWLGGVHLQGAESPWRWDEAQGKLVNHVRGRRPPSP